MNARLSLCACFGAALRVALFLSPLLLPPRIVSAQPAISGCGTITGATTWSPGSVYVLNGCGVTIEVGASLTIQAGTIVKLAGSHDQIVVNGELVTAGTAASPVVLTSLRDDGYGGDTNGDGAATAPAPGDWGWVLFNAGSQGTLGHAVLGYGGVGYHGYTHWATIKAYAASALVIDHTTLQKSWGNGLYAENTSVHVSNSRIVGNGAYGLNYEGLDPAVDLVITDNVFETDRPGASAGRIKLANLPAHIRLLRNSGVGTGRNGIVLEGRVERDLALAVEESLPLIVPTSFSVAAEATLTVSPGTVFKLAGCGGKIFIDGTWLALGTAESPIVITSLNDDSYGNDTNGDGATSVPQPGDWGYVRFSAGAAGAFDHASIFYGGIPCSGYDSYSMLQVYDANVTLDRTTLGKSWGSGLFSEGSSVRVRSAHILDNGQTPASAGLTYNGLDPDLILEISDSIFETRSSMQTAARVTFGSHPAEVLMRRNSVSGSGRNGIVIGGTVQRDLNLTVAESLPFIVEGSLGVAADATLVLSPGTVFKSTGCGAKLNVDGTLTGFGSADEPIVFTSLKDDSRGGDTNGDGSASAPQPSDWGYVRFGSGSAGTLEHVFFGYGGIGCSGYDTYTLLQVHEAVVDIEHATFDAYRWNAVHSYEARLRIHRSNFPSDLSDNPTAIRNAGNRLWVDARHNWWGETSGPYNPSRNPSGTGAPVTDLVWFLPWAVDASGTEVTQLLVAGPARVSPGETAEYAVSYYAGETLQDTVLVLDLPDSAVYRDSGNGGVYIPSQHQVTWLLGALPAGTEGTLAASVRYPWGLRNGSVSPIMAWILASNMSSELGFTQKDLELYLTNQPPVETGTIALTDAQIESERAAHAELEFLYQAARRDGLVFAGGERLSFSDGTSLGSLVMFRPDEARMLVWQGNDALSYWVRPGRYGAGDTGGGLSVEQSSLAATFAGTWATADAGGAEAVPAPPAIAYGPCMRNCMLRDVQFSQQNGVLGMLLSSKCTACWQGEKAGCNDCKIALSEQGFDRRYAINHCHQACQGAGAADYRCTDSAAICLNMQESGFWNPVQHGSFTVFACDPVTGELRPERTVVCPDLHLCYQTRGKFGPDMLFFGEAESYIHEGGNGSAVCQRETVCTASRIDSRVLSPPRASLDAQEAPAPTEEAGAHRCGLALTTVRNAKDPNAKSGVAGDVVPGQEVTYTVEYENVGEGTAYGVFITDELSRHLDETTLDLQGQGAFLTSIRTIMWEIGELAPKGQEGSKGQRTFTIQTRAGLPSGTVITNQAVVFFPSVPEETKTNTVVNIVQPLAAVSQSLETDLGTPIAITLSGLDVSGTPLTYSVEEPPLNGELRGTTPNLTYTSADNFTGQDRFTFVANNGTSHSRPADVTVLVNPSPTDTSSPEVRWTYPEDGALLDYVPADPVATDGPASLYAPSVRVGFSEAMDPRTITGATVIVTDETGADVVATVSWDGTINQAVLAPHQRWRDGTFTAEVTTAARDASGNPLESDVVWSFSIDASASACTGDCDGSGNVTVNELIRGVNIALGMAVVAQCPSFDTNDDGYVSINELVSAVNNALGGCA